MTSRSCSATGSIHSDVSRHFGKIRGVPVEISDSSSHPRLRGLLNGEVFGVTVARFEVDVTCPDANGSGKGICWIGVPGAPEKAGNRPFGGGWGGTLPDEGTLKAHLLRTSFTRRRVKNVHIPTNHIRMNSLLVVLYLGIERTAASLTALIRQTF